MSIAVSTAEGKSASVETIQAETIQAETIQAETEPAEAAPESPAPDTPAPETPLTLRQDEFCRHYAATGNAAAAAREAGYAEGSARQTGHELLARADIAERVRAIRAAWRDVEREEAQILLGRLEQAWDVAVEQGSASLMLRAIKLQAELSGLDRRTADRRAGLWPLPGEEADEEAPPGPLAEAVRRGRHRSERALALHRVRRKALARRKDFDEADWLATAHRLHGIVEDRRPYTPERPADAPANAPELPEPTDPDIPLHRAGLMPAQRPKRPGAPAFNIQAWRDDPFGQERRVRALGRKMTLEEELAYRAAHATERALSREREYDCPTDPDIRLPHGGFFPQPAGDPCPEERRRAEVEQENLKEVARIRPPLASETSGNFLYDFMHLRPCRGEEPDHDDYDDYDDYDDHEDHEDRGGHEDHDES